MFVSDANLFNPAAVRVRVVSMEGQAITMEVAPDLTADQLKIQAVGHFYSEEGSVKASLYHRLLSVKRDMVLDEEKSLTQCGVRDGDELILLKKRINPPNTESAESKLREDSRKSATLEEVVEATRDLTIKNADRPHIEAMDSSHFQEELKRILVSLVDVAHTLLCLNPDAVRTFEKAEKMLSEPLLSTSEISGVQEEEVSQLTGMGFQRETAIRALKCNKSLPSAIQWLLENNSDSDSPEGAEATLPTPPPPPSPPQGAAQEDEKKLGFSNLQDLTGLPAAIKVHKLLSTFRAFRRHKFKPNPRALKHLVEMGFTERDAVDALRINNNREEEACEWLLSGQRQGEDEGEPLEGLAQDSPIYKGIMANPVVQLGLSNPRSLLAFLSMLENPFVNTQQWLSDPDTSAMLVQISRVFHAEKHASRDPTPNAQNPPNPLSLNL